jgi:hypothetical protein
MELVGVGSGLRTTSMNEICDMICGRDYDISNYTGVFTWGWRLWDLCRVWEWAVSIPSFYSIAI